MEESVEETISLRKPTESELAIIKEWAAKRDRDLMKDKLLVASCVLCIPVILFVANEIFLHKFAYRWGAVILFAVIFIGVAKIFIGSHKAFSKLASKEPGVQRGRIVDKKKSSYSEDVLEPQVVFESDTGIRSTIPVRSDNYLEFEEDPCIVVKWDENDGGFYSVLKLDGNE